MRTIIDYDKNAHTIKNADQIGKSCGARLLLAVESPYPGEYVAKRWLRKIPSDTARCEIVIRF